MNTKLSVIVAFIALILSQHVRAQGTAVLKPSDPVTIELKVPAEDSANVSSTYTVSETGTLKMPFLEQEISAKGLSVSQLARRIEAAYKEAGIYSAPTINVHPINTPGAAHSVTVGGEVKTGGAQVPLRENMSLYAAIMSAGGFTEFADVRRVKLIRASKATIYDMRDIKADGSNNPVLKDGDLIHVPAD